MSKFIEKYVRIVVFAIWFAILFVLRDTIDVKAVDDLLYGFLNISSIFTGLLTVSLMILISEQNKEFIKIAKTSGAYQMLLRYIYVAIIYCVISILLVIFAKLLAFEILKLFALSVCFGSFSSALLAEFLFVKLMKLNSDR